MLSTFLVIDFDEEIFCCRQNGNGYKSHRCVAYVGNQPSFLPNIIAGVRTEAPGAPAQQNPRFYGILDKNYNSCVLYGVMIFVFANVILTLMLANSISVIV